MHLNEIAVQNFQGFSGFQNAECAPLTIIFGPNASGKSSISRALKLLKQSTKLGPLEFDFVGEQINLKSRRYTTFGQNEGVEVGVGVSFSLDPSDPSSFGLESVGVIKFESESHRRFRIVATVARLGEEDGYSYSFEYVVDVENSGSIAINDVEFAERHFRQVLAHDEMIRELTWIDNSLDIYQDSEGNKWMGFLDDESNQKWVSESGHETSTLDFSRLTKVGNADLDGFKEAIHEPSWAEMWESSPSFSVDTSFSLQITSPDEDGIAWTYERPKLINEIKKLALDGCNKYFEGFGFTTSIRPIQEEISAELARRPLETINGWLDALTEGRYSVVMDSEPAFDRLFTATRVHDSLTQAEVNFENVGAGLSQILPILEGLAVGPKSLFVEQPELHLHPKMQADLADVFLDSLESDDGPSQLFVETHSESILLRIQRRIREGRISADSVKIIYCEPENDWYDLTRLEEVGNSADTIRRLIEWYSGEEVEALRKKNYYLPLQEGLLRKMAENFEEDIKLPEPRVLGNSMVNLSLDAAGDVLDPFPVSFSDLRLADLIA